MTPSKFVGIAVALGIVVASLVVDIRNASAQDDDCSGTPPLPPTTLDFRNTVTGNKLDFSCAKKEGSNTPGVAKFFETGHDPYLEDKSCLKVGESLFLTSCSGCHGEIGEGKIGPGLNDSYWTYPKNMSDQGIFETIYGVRRRKWGRITWTLRSIKCSR
jgi:cytochrome c(L)